MHPLKSDCASLLGLPRYCPLFPSSWSAVALWLRVSRAALPWIKRCPQSRPCSLLSLLNCTTCFFSCVFLWLFIPGFWPWTNSVFNYNARTQMTVCSQTSASTGPTRPEGYKRPYLTVPQTGIERSREPERRSGGSAPSTRTTPSHPGLRPLTFFGWQIIMLSRFPSEWK